MKRSSGTISVITQVKRPIDKTWLLFTDPVHVMGWNFASPDWWCPSAVSALEPGGAFNYRMESRDGKTGFDFCGKFETIEPGKRLVMRLADGRRVEVLFTKTHDGTEIIERFDPDASTPLDLQKKGWHAILDQFKTYANRCNVIIPNLWFDNEAEEAAQFYTSIFPNSKITRTTCYPAEMEEVSGKPADSVLTVEFSLNGSEFISLNGGDQFKINPSISFIVNCAMESELVRLWEKLSENAKVIRKLGNYIIADQLGWLIDRFGVSWVLVHSNNPEFIVPGLIFDQTEENLASEAVSSYGSLFRVPKDALKKTREQFSTLEYENFHFGFLPVFDSQLAIAVRNDLGGAHFNEAVSLMLNCQDQDEIDYYWNGLMKGGTEQACGWLKDQFGISWQISPLELPNLSDQGDKSKAGRVVEAMLGMKKMDIDTFRQVSGY